MTTPHRVQRSRAAGWKMPPNTVYVGRPGLFGNPFTIADCRKAGFPGKTAEIATWCADAFHRWLADPLHWDEWIGPKSYDLRQRIIKNIPKLRGKNLACWCPLDAPCHADTLLAMANKENDRMTATYRIEDTAHPSPEWAERRPMFEPSCQFIGSHMSVFTCWCDGEYRMVTNKIEIARNWCREINGLR